MWVSFKNWFKRILSKISEWFFRSRCWTIGGGRGLNDKWSLLSRLSRQENIYIYIIHIFIFLIFHNIQAKKCLYLYNPYFYLLDIPQYPGKKMFVFIIHTFIFLIFHNIQTKIFVFIIYTFIFLIFHNIQAKIFVFIKSVFFSLWKTNPLTNRLTNWQVHPTQDPVRSSQNKYQGENKTESKNKGKRLKICRCKNTEAWNETRYAHPYLPGLHTSIHIEDFLWTGEGEVSHWLLHFGFIEQFFLQTLSNGMLQEEENGLEEEEAEEGEDPGDLFNLDPGSKIIPSVGTKIRPTSVYVTRMSTVYTTVVSTEQDPTTV